MIHCIYAPIGGYMNHLRWLLLMSSDYQFFPNELKLKFIQSLVYDSNRTCFNWLNYEWELRTKKLITESIQVTHDLDVIKNIQGPKKIIGLSMDPYNALYHYFKFNPVLNLMGEEGFLNSVLLHNNSLSSLTEDALILPADSLSNEILDQKFYNKVVEFLNIENSYELANFVHKLWYDLNNKSIDLIKSVPREVKRQPWNFQLRKTVSVTDYLTTQDMYDKILEQIDKIYGNK